MKNRLDNNRIQPRFPLDLEDRTVNEGTKTGIFWAAALTLVSAATYASLPAKQINETDSLIGNPLFPTFTDPLAANNLRVVSFNADQGEITRFEVAKDATSGVWSLPSRNNYPADASEQMQKAANALVGLKVLDIQTENKEDHAKLGVVEPKPETLQVGDEGVGRLVAIRGDKNVSLANLIIGNAKGADGKQRYVRIPGQDPVYVVNLDDTVFSSRFDDWIEKDLLQLSSIDIKTIALQSYNAALEPTGAVALNKGYDATLTVDDTNTWQVKALNVYDGQQQAQPRTLAEGEKLSVTRLNQLKNSLDELKIADVASKPKGMTESLKAEKELATDNEAVRSLATRGFFPLSSGDVISANGELDVTLKDGVQYVLRFGNVEGLSEEEKPKEGEEKKEGEEPKASSAGANRYLLITAQVDESSFPPPELKEVPKTVEELEAMDKAAAEKAAADNPAPAADGVIPEPASPTETTPPADKPADDKPADDKPADDKPADDKLADDKPADDKPAEEPKVDAEKPADATDGKQEGEGTSCGDDPASEEKPADDKPADDKPADDKPAEDKPAEDKPAEDKPAEDKPAEDKPADDKPAEDKPAEDKPAEDKPAGDKPAGDKPAEDKPAGDKPAEDKPAEDKPAEDKPAGDKPAEDKPASEEPAAPSAPSPETPEEKAERLEIVQEQITKENQRLMDERKEKIEAARRRVRDLNGRFAQWYYVIPESTYRNLQLTLDDLIEKPAAPGAGANSPGGPTPAPTFQIPGIPGVN